MSKVTVRESIVINAPREKVWEYTQDWRRRLEWDDSVVKVESIREAPDKFVRAKFRGGLFFDIHYKLNERPRKTSLVMRTSHSKWVTRGGGSWTYEEVHGKTKWTQVNTIEFKTGILTRAFLPLLNYAFRRSTQKAMRKAKKRMELPSDKVGAGSDLTLA